MVKHGNSLLNNFLIKFKIFQGFGLLVNNLRDNFTQKIVRLNFSKCNLGAENDKSLKILALKISGLKYLDLSFNQ